jgi:molecular chaperone GrpE
VSDLKEKTASIDETSEKNDGNSKPSRKKTFKQAKKSTGSNDLEKKLAASLEEQNKLKDQLLRKMAEFDNYKRRTEKEFIYNIQNASQELIEELLPVLDDFERSIQHAEAEKVHSPMLEGVQLIYKNLMKILSKRGLVPIEAIGKEFNPDEHDALVQVESDKYESGFVVDEHLKGYKLNDKVIRHTQVLVSK